MNIGLFDQRITLQHPVRMPDGGGGHSIDWTPVATVWAKVDSRVVGDPMTAMRDTPRHTYIITIRNRADVTAQMRVVWKNQVLQITGLPQSGERDPFRVLHCSDFIRAGFHEL
jgi:SPP1 family predicted phage head-tail adaptor